MNTLVPSAVLAEILADMPDLWRHTLGAHSPDANDLCQACRDEQGAARWPCLPHAIAAEARRIFTIARPPRLPTYPRQARRLQATADPGEAQPAEVGLFRPSIPAVDGDRSAIGNTDEHKITVMAPAC